MGVPLGQFLVRDVVHFLLLLGFLLGNLTQKVSSRAGGGCGGDLTGFVVGKSFCRFRTGTGDFFSRFWVSFQNSFKFGGGTGAGCGSRGQEMAVAGRCCGRYGRGDGL